MQPKFLKYILLSLLLTLAMFSQAKDKTSAYFEEEVLFKKGIYLSELGLLSNNKAKLKYSGAMRYDANYAPAPTDGGKPIDLPIDQLQKYIGRAHASLNEVRQSQAYTTALSGKDIKLPLGIKRTVGNKEIVICLDSLVFTPTYAYGVLYVIIEDTKNNKTLAFLGRDIRFTKDGGFTGDARLELMQTYDLQFGQNTTISFLVDRTHENYVVFNCDGFKHLHVDARVFFSRSMFLPEDAGGTVLPTPAQVTTDFRTDFESFDNWLVQISNVPRFQVVGLEGMSFQIGAIAFDYSTTQNPTGILFPTGYTNPALTASDQNPWEGFFIRNLSVTLPEQFKLKSNSTKRITLSIETALIDKTGFTGRASVENLIPLNDGEMSSWSYSLDYLSVDIIKNTPVAASFRGQLVIPITKETETFAYSASILPNNNYNFTLTVNSKLSFPMWGAGSVDINPDSWVSISLIDKKFVPVASLNGKLSITATINGSNGDNNTTDKNSNLTLAEIKFTKLIIKTTGAIISLDRDGGAVSFGSPALEQKMANLPITISNVGLKTRTSGGKEQIGISLTVSVNLVGESENGGGFSGSASITVWGEQGTDKKLRYYKTELDAIEFKNIKIAVLTLNGSIQFYRDDPAYGSGFSGMLDLDIELASGTNIGVKVSCIFGKKPLPTDANQIYRYWMVDALVRTPAISLYPGLLFLNTFGGGVSYRMAMQNTPIPNAKFVSNSGVAYLPDYSKGIGLKALIGIQGASRKLYEGQIIFEIEFNAGGGLSMIAFSGYVQIASLGQFDQLQKLKSSMGGFVTKAQKGSAYGAGAASGGEVYSEIQKMGDGGALLAQWRMVYDRNNKTFTANIDIFVDVVGIVKGVHANGCAGRIDVLFAPNDWHIMVGKPYGELGLNLINVMDITAYFMMGKGLPTPRPMPNGSRAAFPDVSVNGMGIGARIHMGVEGGGAFWYRAGADAGFDFLIWDVSGQICNGKQKGVKGWYGAGQAFLYGYAGAGFKKCFKVGYPCQCKSCHSCSKKCWRPWCWGCSWCTDNVCVDVSANLTIDVSAQVEAPNPTYVEARLEVCGIGFTIKAGKRCS